MSLKEIKTGKSGQQEKQKVKRLRVGLERLIKKGHFDEQLDRHGGTMMKWLVPLA